VFSDILVLNFPVVMYVITGIKLNKKDNTFARYW